MSYSKKKQAVNLRAEIHHHQPFGCYTIEDIFFAIYLYVTVRGMFTNLFSAENVLQLYKCVNSLQAIISGSGGD